MNVTIKKHALSGTITAPPSKSAAHRMIIAASRADGESVINNVAMSEDIKATAESVKRLSADVEFSGSSVKITGNRKKRGEELFANESGSTLRFLLPLCLDGEEHTITGAKRLFERPLTVYEDIFKSSGIYYKKTENSITVKGRLTPGEYEIPGDISSQFITGLLFALPECPGESRIKVTGQFESRSYVLMTLAALKAFGVDIEFSGNEFIIPGDMHYRKNNVTVEGDWSNAAFFKALGLFGSQVTVTGLSKDSFQGDKVCDELFEKIKSGRAKISLADCPDLAPVLFVAAARCSGAEFYDTRRLKIKESDRAGAMAAELSKMGVDVTVGENTVTVGNGLRAPSEPLDSHNDHRIAMALSAALTQTGGTIKGAEAVKKSMPDFYGEMIKLGAEVVADEDN